MSPGERGVLAQTLIRVPPERVAAPFVGLSLVCSIGKNQAGTAAIVVRAIYGAMQGSALPTGQGDGPPIFFRQRSPSREHSCCSTRYGGRRGTASQAGSVFAGSRANTTSAKAVH
jgi:hypothetical protein